jgi:hypothetical protein
MEFLDKLYNYTGEPLLMNFQEMNKLCLQTLHGVTFCDSQFL